MDEVQENIRDLQEHVADLRDKHDRIYKKVFTIQANLPDGTVPYAEFAEVRRKLWQVEKDLGALRERLPTADLSMKVDQLKKTVDAIRVK